MLLVHEEAQPYDIHSNVAYSLRKHETSGNIGRHLDLGGNQPQFTVIPDMSAKYIQL